MDATDLRLQQQTLRKVVPIVEHLSDLHDQCSRDTSVACGTDLGERMADLGMTTFAMLRVAGCSPWVERWLYPWHNAQHNTRAIDIAWDNMSRHVPLVSGFPYDPSLLDAYYAGAYWSLANAIRRWLRANGAPLED